MQKLSNRLVEQGEFLLKTFHAEYEKDPAGYETEFLRGDLAGWRDTFAHVVPRLR
jgi:hypothetical protein